MTIQQVKIASAIIVSSLFIACASNPTANTNVSNTSKPADQVAATPSPASNTAASNAANVASKPAGKLESTYTDVSVGKCKTTDSNEEEGWIIQVCDGIEGYKLEVYEDDIRQSMNVIAPSGTKSELDFQSKVSGTFSTLGEKAEWRVETKDGKKIPRAMIVRFNAADRKDEKKTVSSLVVIKIGAEESCITDVVAPSPKQNEEARSLADSASTKPCKQSNQ